MTATQAVWSPEQRPPLSEPPTAAPVVGEVLDTFSSRLDERNALRLPAVSADAGALGPFWLAAASCTGLSHLHKGTTGQDSYSFSLAEDEAAVVLAVADGLGSRPASAQIGAMAAARSFCSSVACRPSATVSRRPIPAMRAAVVEVNRRLRILRRQAFPQLIDEDFSNALGFCWIPTDYRRSKAVVGRVGDCAVFTLRGATYEAGFEPGDGPLNVVSASLPTGRPAKALEVQLLDLSDKDAVVLATDGLADDIFSSPAVRTWLAACWGERCGPFRMLDSLRYRRRGSHDDRTAVVLWLASLTEAPGPSQ